MTDGATNAVSIHQGAYDTCSCLDTKRVHIPPSVGTVTQTTAHFAPWIRLVSPTGVLLGNSFTQTGASNIAATAPTSGTYTVIIGSYLGGFYDGTGSYRLTLAQGRSEERRVGSDGGGPRRNGASNAGR